MDSYQTWQNYSTQKTEEYLVSSYEMIVYHKLDILHHQNAYITIHNTSKLRLVGVSPT